MYKSETDKGIYEYPAFIQQKYDQWKELPHTQDMDVSFDGFYIGLSASDTQFISVTRTLDTRLKPY